ncbi:unnamed protein product [Larinioides sclopetarius]|uniref:Uncharacterized protein n=1 Tax=Larinioides sclopetarius TaxID=280406 RepID=A0AAV1Z7J0_9ARAC
MLVYVAERSDDKDGCPFIYLSKLPWKCLKLLLPFQASLQKLESELKLSKKVRNLVLSPQQHSL